MIAGSVADTDAIQRLANGCDIVFNLARAKAHGALPTREVTATNIVGARNVARAASRAGAHVIHASSTAVYGYRPGKIPVTEEAPPNPDSAYARSKLDGENAVRSESPIATVMRISAVLGPRCHSWLSLFQSASTGTLRLAGNGSNVHHPVDVADVVDALILASEKTEARGRTYNIAGLETVTMAQLASLMSAAYGTGKSGPRPLPGIVTDIYIALGNAFSVFGVRMPRLESAMFLTANRAFDISRARREIGYNPAITVAASVQRTANFYKSEQL